MPYRNTCSYLEGSSWIPPVRRIGSSHGMTLPKVVIPRLDRGIQKRQGWLPGNALIVFVATAMHIDLMIDSFFR